LLLRFPTARLPQPLDAPGYITAEQHAELTALCAGIGKMLGSMLNNPTPFLISDF